MRGYQAIAAILCVLIALWSSAASAIVTFRIDSNVMTEPLGGLIGDAVRGRAIVADRKIGLCLLCHSAPIPEERFQGNLSQSLAGVGSRATAGQLRMRLVDARKMNSATIMPSYYRIDNLTRVSAAHRGRTILSAQQIEDVIAYLLTLKVLVPRADDKP